MTKLFTTKAEAEKAREYYANNPVLYSVSQIQEVLVNGDYKYGFTVKTWSLD